MLLTGLALSEEELRLRSKSLLLGHRNLRDCTAAAEVDTARAAGERSGEAAVVLAVLEWV